MGALRGCTDELIRSGERPSGALSWTTRRHSVQECTTSSIIALHKNRRFCRQSADHGGRRTPH